MPRSTKKQPIRLVIVEPRAVLGIGIREVLDREKDIEIVAQVTSPDEAIPVIQAAPADIVLVDVTPDVSGSNAIRRLRRGAPASALVVLGGDDDASILAAMEVGATAHVGGLAEPSELVATIRRVAGGEDPLRDQLIARPDLVERILESFREAIEAGREPTNPLTPRELQIITLVGHGLRNQAIADTLSVSEQTVKNHLSSIMHKFGVTNRRQAVGYAVRHGWLVLRPGDDGPAADPGSR